MSEPQSPHTVHFAPGLGGALRWMGYWVGSRSANAARAAHLLWRSEVLPEWSALLSRLTSDTRAAADRVRSADGLGRFAPTPEGARSHGLTDARA